MLRYRKIPVVGIAAALVLSGTPAHAQDVNDVRCLIASNMFVTGAKEEKAKRAADAAKYFYLGRIAGRLSAGQLEAELVAQQKTITTKNASSVMGACFEALQRSAKVVESAGKQIGSQKQ